MEQINAFFGRVFDYLRDNPKYGLFVAMALVALYLLGLILNWKWTLLPGSFSDFTQMWIEIFGEKAVRFGKGVIAVLLLVCLLYIYISNFSSKYLCLQILITLAVATLTGFKFS